MNQTATFERLVAFVAGDLDPAAAREVEAAIAADPAAAANVTRIRGVIETMRSDDSVEPPAATLDQARLLFRERRVASAPGLLDAVRQLVANLVYDSRSTPAMAGLRGAGEGYQLSYDCDSMTVDLDIEPARVSETPQWTLTGQISGDAGVEQVTLTAPGSTDPVISVVPDETGMFSVTTCRGNFDVLITCADARVVLSDVPIE